MTPPFLTFHLGERMNISARTIVRWNWGRILSIAAAELVVLVAFFLWGWVILPLEGNDWLLSFRPAIVELFAGRSPYTAHGFLSPPWVLGLLSPFALLPPGAGLVAIAFVNLIAFGFAARRMGASPLAITCLLVTPQVLWGSRMGNIDWLVALGLVMPPQIGLFFVLAKPQIGAAIALFWLIEAWRRGGWREAVRVFAPVGAVTLASFALFGLWPLRSAVAIDVPWNISLFPYSLPIGLVLLTSSVRRRKLNLAIQSSPFFSPYIALYSLPVAVLGLLPSQVNTIICLAGLWVVFLIRGPF